MRESVSGVFPRSYSGSKVPFHDSGKGYRQVTLLAGLGSEELTHNGIRPSSYLPHASQGGLSIIHRTSGFVSCLLGGGLPANHLFSALISPL